MDGHRRLAAAAALAVALVGTLGVPAGAAPNDPGVIGPAPCVRTLQIGDRAVAEGTRLSTAEATHTAVSFPVTSSGCARATTVSWGTMGMSASSTSDFVLSSGTVTFPAGSHATRWLTVPVKRDGSPGTNESYWVFLHTPSSGTVLADPNALGTILNDDASCTPQPEWNPQPPYYPDYHCSE